MSTIQIVSMEERHLDELAEISQLCFRNAVEPGRAGGGTFPAIPRTFWVAEKEGYCLGFAGMHAVCGECYGFGRSAASARRQGIGEQLVADDRVDGGTPGEFIT